MNKLLTLNTHSLMESQYETKLEIFINWIKRNKPDLIALQEIMQPIQGKVSNMTYINAGEIPLKEGNHALNLVKCLPEYNLIWLGFKRSYDKYDEGLAILTLHKIENFSVINLSPFDDYNNWKTRKALGVLVENQWFYSVHMGWWDDNDSPLKFELERLINGMPKKCQFWLMGDFNSIANERNKGYDLAIANNLYDTYNLALNKDNGATASTLIDGWDKKEKQNIRIDYIFTNRKEKIESSFTVFNGDNEKRVSDHNGIVVIVGKDKE